MRSTAGSSLSPANQLSSTPYAPATVPPDVAAVVNGGGSAPAGLAGKERAAFDSLHTLSKKNASTRGVSQGIDRYHRLMDAVHHCWFNGMSIVDRKSVV